MLQSWLRPRGGRARPGARRMVCAALLAAALGACGRKPLNLPLPPPDPPPEAPRQGRLEGEGLGQKVVEINARTMAG